MLVEQVEQLDEVADDLAGRDVLVGADATVLHLDECYEVIGGETARIAVKVGVHLRQLFAEHQHLLGGERLQPDDGREQVAGTRARELALREPRTQSFVAVNAPPLVLQSLRCRTHDDAQVTRLALQRVVVHRQHLLVVVLSRDGVRNLVDVHQLVNHNHQPCITGQAEEGGEELQVVVPVVVSDDDVHPEFLLGLLLETVFPSEPTHYLRLGHIIALHVCVVVAREQTGELEPMDELADGGGDGIDLPIHRLREVGVTGGEAALLHSLRLHVVDPTVEDKGQRTALRLGLGREIADELAVGGQALPARALQPPLGREVGIRDDEPTVHHVVADGLQQEALARAVAAYDEPARRAALADDIDIVEQRLDLALPPHGNIGQPNPRHHPTLQRVEYRLGNPLRCFSVLFVHISCSIFPY